MSCCVTRLPRRGNYWDICMYRDVVVSLIYQLEWVQGTQTFGISFPEYVCKGITEWNEHLDMWTDWSGWLHPSLMWASLIQSTKDYNERNNRMKRLTEGMPSASLFLPWDLKWSIYSSWVPWLLALGLEVCNCQLFWVCSLPTIDLCTSWSSSSWETAHLNPSRQHPAGNISYCHTGKSWVFKGQA